MRFYHEIDGIHWDAENNRPLAEFRGGVAEVSDPGKIKRMQALGYQTDTQTDEGKRPTRRAQGQGEGNGNESA